MGVAQLESQRARTLTRAAPGGQRSFMRQVFSRLAARRAVSVLLSIACSVASAAGLTVTDDAGRKLTLPRTPQTIVSIAPGATEMLFAAGAGSRVIATVEFSDEPRAAKQVPRIGDGIAIDMERVVALQPDVVVVWEGGSNSRRSRSSSVSAFRSIAQKVEQTGGPAALVAAPRRRSPALALSRKQRRAIWNRAWLRWRSASADARRSTVLLQVWNRPIYTVGGTHMMSDSLRLCGAQQHFRGPERRRARRWMSRPSSRAIPRSSSPWHRRALATEWLEDWKRFGSLRAVRNGRTHCVRRRAPVAPRPQRRRRHRSALSSHRQAQVSSARGGRASLFAQSRKLLNCSGTSTFDLRSSAMASCRSSRCLPVTRTLSPWRPPAP